MEKSDTQENANVEAGIPEKPAETLDENVTQQNVNSESITPVTTTYTTLNLGLMTYKAQLTGKLKIAEIIQNILVIMVARHVSYPESNIDVYVKYLLVLGVAGLCISAIIFLLHSCGIIDLYMKTCRSTWLGFEFVYCLLWLIQYLVGPSLILGFIYSRAFGDYDEAINTESYKKDLIFMVVVAYFSTIIYAWDLWITFRLTRKKDASMLKPTSSSVA